MANERSVGTSSRTGRLRRLPSIDRPNYPPSPCGPTGRDEPDVATTGALDPGHSEASPHRRAHDPLGDALARRSPTNIALIIDEVHRLLPGSSGEALLARLARDLPANAHLVLAGRRLPRLPLTRYAASGQVTALRADDLALDDAEIRALADACAVDPAVLEVPPLTP